MGAQLFQDRQSDLDEISGIIAVSHHERWDGKGYPGHVDIATDNPLPGYEKPDGNAIRQKRRRNTDFRKNSCTGKCG